LKGLKQARKKQIKKPINIEENKYEVPLDNSLMQRIKLSEVVLEKESKLPSGSESSMSPQTHKSIASPNKSNIHLNESVEKDSSVEKSVKIENKENEGAQNQTSAASDNKVNKRETLFDLRKKKESSTKSIVPDKVDLDKKEEVKKEEAKKEESKKEQAKKEEAKKEQDKKIADEKKLQEDKKAVVVESIKESEAEEESEEVFDYELYSLDLSEKEALTYLKNYLKLLDDNLSKSFPQPDEIFKKCSEGNNAQWYGIKNKASNSELDGLFIYSLDSHFDRLNILHLTTISRKGLDSAVGLALSHMWDNENVNECRIGLYHYDGEKAGKPAKVVDPDLRDVMKKHKLRWKQILNEKNDRIIVMGGTRPDTAKKAENDLEHILSIKSSLLFSISDSVPRINTPGSD